MSSLSSKPWLACLVVFVPAVVVLAIPIVLAGWPGFPTAGAQTVLLVTNNADAGPGTLRDAIERANTDDEPDTINFSSSMTIHTLSRYQLTENYPCAIDAQGRDIVLDCSLMPAGIATECLLVTTDNNLVSGLKIVNMPVTGDPDYGVGIRFRGTSGNQVTGCYLGTADGTTAASNDTGISLEDCGFPWTVIGMPGDENVISGNRTCGVRVRGGSRMTIRDNRIGTSADGTAALGNGTCGIDLDGVSRASVLYNTVSASATSIYLNGEGDENLIAGNRVGTNAAGTAVLSDPDSDTGILVEEGASATIGGSAALERNVISGLNLGIRINEEAGPVAIEGNYIGTDNTGSVALGDGYAGILTSNTGTLIGGSGEGGNLVSSWTFGVRVENPAAGVRLRGNIIGLNASGTAPLGEMSVGVLVTGPDNRVGSPDEPGAKAGGNSYAAGGLRAGGNVISGCDRGLDLAGRATGTTVRGNFFGTDVGGSAAIPNRENVRVRTGGNAIGGVREGEGNLISGAEARGLYIESGSGNEAFGNLVGTNASGSGAIPNGVGMDVSGSGGKIGGELEGQANTIAHSRGAGVRVRRGAHENKIGANSFHSNVGLGIDLDPVGPNVPQDDFPYPSASGPNRNMHFPVIEAAERYGDTLTVEGTAVPSSTVRVYYADGKSGEYGEGRSFIGGATASREGRFRLSSVTEPVTGHVTATATDGRGNTSEFALNTAVINPDELSKVYYIAEGYTANNTYYPGEFFDTYILVQNPSPAVAKITATFMRNTGLSDVIKEYSVAPRSRFTISVDRVPGLEACEVSGRIECTNGVGIAVERSMYFRYKGRMGGSSSVAVTAPSRTWYFAEGHTADGFDTWLLIQNPGEEEARCTVTFMDREGNVSRPTFSVAPRSRYTVEVDEVPGFEANHVSMAVSSDRPVVAERSMYFDYGGWAGGGHNSTGAPGPATDWYLPEGYTVQDPARFDTWVLLENPTADTCRVYAAYMTNFDRVVEKSYELRAHSRHTVKINEITGLQGTDVSTRVRSTNGVPFVAERSSYFDYYGITGGSNSAASPAAHSSWYVPEGYSSEMFQTYILVENPNERQAACDFSLMSENGEVVTRRFVVPPTSRFTLCLDDVGPSDIGIATMVSTSRDTPVVVEKATYFNYKHIDGGASSLGIGIH